MTNQSRWVQVPWVVLGLATIVALIVGIRSVIDLAASLP